MAAQNTTVFLLVLCLAGLQLSSAALNAYAYIRGSTQGQFKGSVTQRGRENSIMVIATEHTLTRPDSTPSAPGKVVHGPYTIVKELDKSTPLLHEALTTGELLETVEIKSWTPQLNTGTGTGTEVQHFTVLLTNAIIRRMSSIMPNNKDPDLVKLAEYEQIDFTYEKITWTWNDGGITSEASAI